MTTHDRMLELAAGAIDFELTAPERESLRAHLSGCNSCRRQVDALSADARAIAAHRVVTLSPATSSAILARVLSARRTAPPVRLVAIAALLALLTLAAAAVGGALLQRAQDDRLTTVVPPTPVPDGVSPRPSPAAATGQLLFEDGGAIFTVDLASGAVARLADGEGPSWSPDGSLIAFTRPEPPTLDPKIWVMDPDGGNQTQVADGWGPAWSPDGLRIAFSRSMIDQGDLLVMNADGSDVLPLDGGSDFDWSPDSARIATVKLPELVVVQADGTGSTRLAAGQYPDWSPDGTRVAFVSWSPTPSIDLVDPSTGDVTTIAAGVGAAIGVAWSPDGSRIAFTSMDTGDLFVVPVTGGDPVRVVDGADTANAPAWSNDGAWIVFTMEANGAEPPAPDIWLVRSDGSGLHSLTDSGSAGGPAWRPTAP